MAKNKHNIRFFNMLPRDEDTQSRLKIFNTLKEESSASVANISAKTGIANDTVAEFINVCVKKDLLKISGSEKGDPVKFNAGQQKILGVGFDGAECILSVMDLGGAIAEKETIKIDSLVKLKGKNKEIKSAVSEISGKTGLKGNKFIYAGVAVSHEMLELNPKSADILGAGIGETFGCDVLIAREATAAGYGERDSIEKVKGKDILYLHLDVGSGVVIKKEMIFEASDDGAGKNEEYLRAWNQFDIAKTAIGLVNKGLGTDIVTMVNGDVNGITMKVVMQAADNKDELAEDLVKRSGLALGVRLAYLVNMFGVGAAVLGGVAGGNAGNFMAHVKESADKFLVDEASEKLEIISGVLGGEASSVGAASLVRRELFTDVSEV